MSLKVSSAKINPDVNVVYSKRVKDPLFPSHMHENAIGKEDTRKILEAMRSATRHGGLNDTRVDLHGLDLRDYANRADNNRHLTQVGRWWTRRHNEFLQSLMPDKTKTEGDMFLPSSNVVSVPSAMPGVLMHELGHAIDMNDFPTDSRLRQFGAAMYRNMPGTTLWKEHAAWRKGRKALLNAAANKKLDPALAHKTLTNAVSGKRIGLGSYWGSLAGLGLGTAGALGAAVLAAQNNVRLGPNLLFSMVALGSILGTTGGLALGKSLGSKPAKKEKITKTLAKAISKKQNIPYDVAYEDVNRAVALGYKLQKRKNKADKTPLRKAAAEEFGQAVRDALETVISI